MSRKSNSRGRNNRNSEIQRMEQVDPHTQMMQMMRGFGGFDREDFFGGMMKPFGGDPFENMFNFSDCTVFII